MTLAELINKLNDDLSREYAHWHFYMYAASCVQGLHREEFKELFLKEAEGEMEHITAFSDLIVGLGGVPAFLPSELNFPTNRKVESFLKEALKLEEEVVKNYVERMDEAEELIGEDKVHGRYIHIFLEDQILDSRAAVDNYKQLLEGN